MESHQEVPLACVDKAINLGNVWARLNYIASSEECYVHKEVTI